MLKKTWTRGSLRCRVTVESDGIVHDADGIIRHMMTKRRYAKLHYDGRHDAPPWLNPCMCLALASAVAYSLLYLVFFGDVECTSSLGAGNLLLISA